MPSETVRPERIYLYAAVLLGLAGLLFVYLTSPTRLTVAVGPRGGPDAVLMGAFARGLDEDRLGLRLRVVEVADEREAAETLDRSGAELAVVRPDVLLPRSGLTVAILREAAAIIVAPEGGKVDDIPALAGRRLGIVTSHEADPAFLTTLLTHYDLPPPTTTLVPLPRADAVAALKARRIDAVAIVAQPAGMVASEFVREIGRAYDGKITILPVDEASAIAQRYATLEEVTVPSGIWGGRPRQPDEEIKTAAVSYRLMARAGLDRAQVSEVAQYLFQMRSRLSATARSANYMRAPETDTSTSATLPNHPGAVDYFQREQKTFFERYGDWIYLVAIFGSSAVSLLAWVRGRFSRHRREKIEDVLDRILAMVPEARDADGIERLRALDVELDGLFGAAVIYMRSGRASHRISGALTLSLDTARSAVATRERSLAEPAGAGTGSGRR